MKVPLTPLPCNRIALCRHMNCGNPAVVMISLRWPEDSVHSKDSVAEEARARAEAFQGAWQGKEQVAAAERWVRLRHALESRRRFRWAGGGSRESRRLGQGQGQARLRSQVCGRKYAVFSEFKMGSYSHLELKLTTCPPADMTQRK